MNRHNFLLRTTLACITVLWTCASLLAATTKNERPNILFILIDDMGWKDIGYAGSTYYETPHIDKLASEGMHFLNAYSAAPICSPSRGAIFSGKYPARTQFTAVWKGPAGPDDRLHNNSKYSGSNDQYFEARNRHALPGNEVILAQALADGGYRTGIFGKWHMGECPGFYPDDRGFQVAKGYRTKKVATSKSGHWMKTFHKYGANLDGANKDAYVADVLTEECINFITKNKDKPFLAVLSHYLVHNPIQPKPDKLKRYSEKTTTDQTNPGYASMVESVDESVGRLIQTIKDLGLDQDTLVIFTSDNGGLTPNNTSNYPLMGGKSFPFEAGMKVPFIVKWPGKIMPGVSSERIIGMDIYPTMLGASGLPMRPAQHVDGFDLMPLLTRNRSIPHRPLVFHHPHYTGYSGPFSSIIDNDWKLIRFYNDEKGGYLLYNLAEDPNEQKDLAATHVERQNSLAKKLNVLLHEMGAEMPMPNPGKKTGKHNLNFTKKLADKHRKLAEERLKK
jgi:arylsulfatase A